MFYDQKQYEIMFGFIRKGLIGLLAIVVSVSSHRKCLSLSNQKCTIINLHPHEYTQGLRYYQFEVFLYRCVKSCNTLKYLFKT